MTEPSLELAALQAELSVMRALLARQAAESVADRDAAQAQAMRLRGELVARDTRIAQLTEELASLRTAMADLPSRRVLAEQLAMARKHLLALGRTVDRAHSTVQRLRSQDCISDRSNQACAGPAAPPDKPWIATTSVSTAPARSKEPGLHRLSAGPRFHDKARAEVK